MNLIDGPVSDRHAPVSTEKFRQALDRVTGKSIQLSNIHSLSRFSDYNYFLDDYRDRRLLLAGDAAHIHYPLGGQGLNTGISDALNLGWKIAAVVNGHAEAELLNTYSRERQPIAEDLIANTQLQSRLMNPDPKYGPLRDYVSTALEDPANQKLLGDVINGNATYYPVADDSELSGHYMPNFRLELADGQCTDIASLGKSGNFLCIISGNADTDVSRLYNLPMTTTVLSKNIPDDYPDIVFVRPDGYIAWAGSYSHAQESVAKILKNYFTIQL